MIAVKYAGTALDPSGYGAANRNFITALFAAGIDLSTEIIAQTPEKANYGWQESLITSLQDRAIAYKIKIIHLTPDLYPTYLEPGKYHIGHLFFETDRLPAAWIAPCNLMNELWTASEQQAAMIKRSGVTVPIHWFPQPIDTSRIGSIPAPFVLANYDGFLFYSVFQWIERKNPQALLKTFWKTFTGKHDVALLLKTYRVMYRPEEYELIKADIAKWKADLQLPHYPTVFLSKKLMNTDEVFRLHLTGDCFINASRGEGWNIPSVEAMSMGKPMISINQTGIADYLSPQLYYPCGVSPIPATVQPHIPWYGEDQQWLEIHPQELAEHMLAVYNDRVRAKQIGLKAQEYVRDTFNYHTVGMAMKQRLDEISRFI